MLLSRVALVLLPWITAAVAQTGPGLSAQQYLITTVAGGVPPGRGIAPLNASIGAPEGVAKDAAGNVYFSSLNCIFKLDTKGGLTLIAGTSRAGTSGDGGPALNARLSPKGIAVDNAGNIFVADNARVRKISFDGTITTVAGTGVFGFSGDGGQATAAQLDPGGLAIDNTGNLFVTDLSNSRIRKISTTGIITTIAGGASGFSGDGGQAAAAQLRFYERPWAGLTFDSSGNLYFADNGNNRVRRISPNGIITTVAGNGSSIYSGDGVQATASAVGIPVGLAIDNGGNLLIVDSYNSRLRKVAPAGIISTVAGVATDANEGGFSGDGGPATSARLSYYAFGIAVDSAGTIYLADTYNYRIRAISASGVINTVAGNGALSYSGDGGAGATAQLSSPSALALGAAGSLYIVDSVNNRVRRLAADGSISTVAGNGSLGYSGDGGLATNAQLGVQYSYPASPGGVTFDSGGNLYIADSQNHRIRKVAPNGVISTIAGVGATIPGIGGLSGDGGLATNALLNYPSGLAIDKTGNLYIADSFNNRIRKISPSGVITTVAGSGPAVLGQGGFAGDGGLATSAQLSGPRGVAVDSSGNLFIADTFNGRIRKVGADGIITTVAGNGASVCCNTGDGGPATNTVVPSPNSVAVDAAGNLYIAEGYFSHTIRKVTATGVITTIAGEDTGPQGGPGYSGDGGLASSAQLFDPMGIVVDSAGNVFVADTYNDAVRLLQPTGPSLSISSVNNGASNLAGPIAPGEIVVLTGFGLGPSQLTEYQVGASGLINTQLAGTQVFFNGAPAPLIYTWSTQVAAIVPYSTAGNTAQVTVSYQGQTSAAVSVPVASSSPGIFTLNSTGSGAGAVVNQDGSINTVSTPAAIGDIISIYATGEGQTTPSGVDGKPASTPLPRPILAVSVTIDGQPAQVQYAGGGYGEVAGLLQVNAQIPPGIRLDSAVPIALKIGNALSQAGVTIAVR